MMVVAVDALVMMMVIVVGVCWQTMMHF